MLKEEDKGNWTWCANYENHYWKALRRVACYLLFLRQFATLYLLYQIGNIFRCQLITAAKSSWRRFLPRFGNSFCIADHLHCLL